MCSKWLVANKPCPCGQTEILPEDEYALVEEHLRSKGVSASPSSVKNKGANVYADKELHFDATAMTAYPVHGLSGAGAGRRTGGGGSRTVGGSGPAEDRSRSQSHKTIGAAEGSLGFLSCSTPDELAHWQEASQQSCTRATHHARASAKAEHASKHAAVTAILVMHGHFSYGPTF